MPPKPKGQLTQDEQKLLIIATRLLEALRVQAVRPPTTPEQEEYWNTCISNELVRTSITIESGAV